MVAPAPIPIDETARLAALHSFAILDTPPEERFDLFTKMATWLFDVPIAAINFVDGDRTFFKSAVGLTPYRPARSTSICAHAIAGAARVMIIEDLTKDRRFDDHPLATTQGVKFYAGAVLRSTGGHALGTLCVGDVKSRGLSPAKEQQFLELAGGVGAVLDLHMKSILLHKSATTDVLTGLFNRRMFTDALQAAILRATPDAPCLVLSLDLDRFKSVNDRFGHATGDALLCEVGARIRRQVRAGDLVARLGGDEFVVLVSGPVEPKWPERLAARTLAAFAAPFSFDGHTLEISSSIGIARCPRDATDADSLMRCADLALYCAKREGRGRFQQYRRVDEARRAHATGA